MTDKQQGQNVQDEQKEQQEIGLYEKLASRTAEILEESRKTIDEALKKAKEELAAAGDYSREQADKVGVYVQRDLMENASKARDAVVKAVDPQRLAAGAQSAFSRILTSTAETLSEMAAKAEKNLEFRTGEVTSPGTLTCKDCGAELHMTSTKRIPPCPKCHKTLFRKSY
ncbi:MAG: hypothetical protein RQ723_07455 [Desulfuromonadales bacterium]|nr:hypothetical protein [Desulfuromonadales bacterium]